MFVYLNDTLVYSKTKAEHIGHVWQVLQLLIENKLFVKAEKCQSHLSTVSFLGSIIENDWIKATTFIGFCKFFP